MTLHHGTRAQFCIGTCTCGLRTCTPYGFGRRLVALGILRRSAFLVNGLVCCDIVYRLRSTPSRSALLAPSGERSGSYLYSTSMGSLASPPTSVLSCASEAAWYEPGRGAATCMSGTVLLTVSSFSIADATLRVEVA